MTTDVAKAIIDSLEENDDFHELNRGLLFSVESVHYDNRTESLTIELTNNDIHGNIDGGHTLRAIFDAQTEKKDLDGYDVSPNGEMAVNSDEIPKGQRL